MNVMIYNKYKDLLLGLNIEVMKSLEGVYNVDEIIDTFTNFYYDKMILDITAIRDYQNFDNLQKLAMNINMENVILLLDDNPESNSKTYLSKLISLGIYNFTKNVDGINYLIVHPHTYKDVVNIHNLQELEPVDNTSTNVMINVNAGSTNNRLKVIGFKNMTSHAGATSLIYMIKKSLESTRNVSCIEINKVDFIYFNDPNMVSSTSSEFVKDLMKKQGSDLVLVDLNDYEDVDVCTDVYYLIEPSTIMMNRMLRKNRNVLDTLKGKNIVLNRCVLGSGDIATFEYETRLKVIMTIPSVDDRQSSIEPIRNFISKIGL